MTELLDYTTMCSPLYMLALLANATLSLDGFITTGGDLQHLFLLRTSLKRLSILAPPALLLHQDSDVLRSTLTLSGTCKDASVSRDLLSSQPELCHAPSTKSTTATCSYVLDSLEGQRARALEGLLHDWAAPLGAMLQRMSQQVATGAPCPPPSQPALQALQASAAAAAKALRSPRALKASSKLAATLHDLRLAAKAVRYALEPTLPLLQAEVAQLQHLQAALGRVNDASVLSAHLSSKRITDHAGKRLQQGLQELGEQAQRLVHSAVAALNDTWWQPSSRSDAPLPSLLSALASSQLFKNSSASTSTSASKSKSSSRGLEVKRRWALHSLPPALAAWLATGNLTAGLPAVQAVDVWQGYLPGTVISEQVQSSASCKPAAAAAAATCSPSCAQQCSAWAPGSSTAPSVSLPLPAGQHAGCTCQRALVRSVRAGRSGAAQVLGREVVVEEEVGEILFYRLGALTEGQRLHTLRLVVPAGKRGLLWQVALVQGGAHNGTAVLELAGGSSRAAPPFPQWLAGAVGEEVAHLLPSRHLAS